MNEFKALPRLFYRPSAAKVASKLLGHWIVRKTARGYCGGPIVETEAYVKGDAACHAFTGRTPRNRVMWEEPGHCYVYFIYGNHWCVNAVCRPIGEAEAVLIRAVEPAIGIELMREFRDVSNPRHLTNGPGKLCEAMDISREMDGVDLCDVNSALFIAENSSLKKYLRERGPKIVTTRIGITKAAEMPLRFYLAGSEFISRRAVD